jgi:aldose 1-epimerase
MTRKQPRELLTETLITMRALVAASATIVLSGCSDMKAESHQPVRSDVFGYLGDGTAVKRWSLQNRAGMHVELIDLGAIITVIEVPDRDGIVKDVVLGFDEPQPYLTNSPYFGAVVGRYANRIAEGRFALAGENYQLATNNGLNSLHGGERGFDKVMWSGVSVETDRGPGVRLSYFSADGEEGYPGNLSVSVTYVLTQNNELIVDYEAETDKATILNLTQHSYFNLAGQATPSILDQVISINADYITPINNTAIPTGEILSVDGTPLDFREPRAIRDAINSDHPQIKIARGLDHNFVLRRSQMAGEVVQAAVMIDPPSGRKMTVLTDQPGLQVYSGNFLNGSIVGKDGVAYPNRSAIALESQHFPDSPNHPHFPRTTLEPGQTFASRTIFAFDVIERSVKSFGTLEQDSY